MYLRPALILFSFSVACAAPTCLHSQDRISPTDSTTFSQTFGKPLFLYGTHSFKSEVAGKSQLRVYVAFVNDLLQFLRQTDGHYQARYEVLVEIFDQDQRRRDGTILTQEIIVPSYTQTNSRRAVNQHQLAFDLRPGSYELVLQLTDLDTKRQLRRRKFVDVRDFETSDLAVSDLTFVDAVATHPDESAPLFPNLNKTYEDPFSDFSAYFELYNERKDSVELNLRIYNDDNEVLYREDTTVFFPSETVRKYVPIRRLVLSAGQYFLVVRVNTVDEAISVRTGFLINYTEKHLLKSQVDHASQGFRALKYVTSSKDYSVIEKTSSDGRLELIQRFWQERDPTPGTPENELMNEFNRRVEFTLKHFSVPAEDSPGWTTDRGRIYIIYGSPSELQRRGADIDANPYEIWYYSHIDRRFVFMDKSGFGGYRLVHKD